LLITNSVFGFINLSVDEKRSSKTLVVGMDVGIDRSSTIGLGDWGSSP
ncbi:hypothetical protein A2U01_0071225, partial [Trifolium medium]|nr:hypothetical protein [Trifolium medium]